MFMDANGGDKPQRKVVKDDDTIRQIGEELPHGRVGDNEISPSQSLAVAKMIHDRLQTDIRWDDEDDADEVPIYVDMAAAEEIQENEAFARVDKEKRKKEMKLTGTGVYVMQKGADASETPADNKTRVYGIKVPKNLLVTGIKKMFDEFITFFQNGEKLNLIDFMAFYEDMKQHCIERGVKLSISASKREGFGQRISGVVKRVSGVFTGASKVEGMDGKEVVSRFQLELDDDFEKKIDCMLIFDENEETLKLSVVCEEPRRFAD